MTYDGNSFFDQFIERVIQRVDSAQQDRCTCGPKHQDICRDLPDCQPSYCRVKQSDPAFKFSSYGALVSPEDIDIRVTADGYVRSSSKYGKHMELILGFIQVCEVIEEETRRNRGEQP